ncbi:phytanoyl-CoA dioxygenase family protein [Bauldia sp.]|uniref:phytanoyl-CoA dioxygenase family protein n=1 Tax=Bauldia sp. TaxID=2575872 RepID=UPI003BABEEBF
MIDKATYQRDGFAVVPDAVDAETIAKTTAEAARLCREHGADLPLSHRREGATAAATDVADLDDDALLTRFLAIHFPHKLSALFRDMLGHPATVEALRAAIGPNVKCMQSMLFIKSPGAPGQAWHQDEAFIPTRDRSLTGAWLAIDDATVDNGCLWVIPGSHRRGVIYPMQPHGSDEWDPTPGAYGFPEDEGSAQPLEAPSGSLVVFNGYLLHGSHKNRSGGYRRALVNHYMSAESLLPWRQGGRVDVGDDFRDIVMVSGDDPYAYKGTEDLSKPYVRAAA